MRFSTLHVVLPHFQDFLGSFRGAALTKWHRSQTPQGSLYQSYHRQNLFTLPHSQQHTVKETEVEALKAITEERNVFIEIKVI